MKSWMDGSIDGKLDVWLFDMHSVVVSLMMRQQHKLMDARSASGPLHAWLAWLLGWVFRRRSQQMTGLLEPSLPLSP